MLTNFENINTDINQKEKNISLTVMLYIKQSGKIKSPLIEEWFGISGVSVRNIVRYLRNNHYPIGSSTKGYFYCDTETEWQDCIKHIEERVNSLTKTMHEMKRINFKNDLELFKGENNV